MIGNFSYVELNSVSEVQGSHAERESTAVDPKVTVDSTRVHRAAVDPKVTARWTPKCRWTRRESTGRKREAARSKTPLDEESAKTPLDEESLPKTRLHEAAEAKKSEGQERSRYVRGSVRERHRACGLSV